MFKLSFSFLAYNNFLLTMNNNNGESVRGTADLSQIRSQSYNIPRERPNTPRSASRAHFGESERMPNHIGNRPEYNDSSRMNSSINATSSPRPKISSRATSFATAAKRRSMARTISSLSVYSNFAGERLDDSYPRPTLGNLIDEEKNKSYTASRNTSLNKREESVVGEELIEDATEVAPKASVGKAMFMFLKAFIGSGVLFLPKA